MRWTVAWGLRLFAAAMLSGVLVIGTLLAFAGARPVDRVGGGLFLVVTPVVGWLFFVRPYVELAPSSVYVRNPLRAHYIRLEEIKDASPLNTGLALQLMDGSQVVAWALQQGLLVTVLARETRAMKARRMILRAALARRGQVGLG